MNRVSVEPENLTRRPSLDDARAELLICSQPSANSGLTEGYNHQFRVGIVTGDGSGRLIGVPAFVLRSVNGDKHGRNNKGRQACKRKCWR